MNKRIEEWYQAQREGKELPCPRCGEEMEPVLLHNAFSRRADIYICSRCGTNEALEDASHAVNPEFVKLPLSHWYMNLNDDENDCAEHRKEST